MRPDLRAWAAVEDRVVERLIATLREAHRRTAARNFPSDLALVEGFFLGLLLAAHDPRWAGRFLEWMAGSFPEGVGLGGRAALSRLVALGEELDEALRSGISTPNLPIEEVEAP